MNNIIKNNILFVAGGTGGHIYPALAVFNLFNNFKNNIFFATDQRGMRFNEVSLIKPFLISAIGYEGKSFSRKILSLIFLVINMLKAILFLKKNNIKTIIGFGSYVQVPFVFAAIILRKNVILHEGNSVMGKANKLFWNSIKIRTSAFDLEDKHANTINIGMPVRGIIFNLYKNKYKPITKNVFNLLVLGGSQGSKVLSYKLSLRIIALSPGLKNKIKVYHQVRNEDLYLVKKIYKKNNIKSEVVSFFTDINNKIKKASLIISRAGSSTIFENAIAGVPAIYFPIKKSSGNHQYKNAEFFKSKRAAWVFDEEEIEKKFFLNELEKIINNESLLKEYSVNKKKISKPKAANKLKELIVSLESANV